MFGIFRTHVGTKKCSSVGCVWLVIGFKYRNITYGCEYGNMSKLLEVFILS